MNGRYVVIPFQVTDGEDNWTGLKVALVFVEGNLGVSEASQEFTDSYVHPHADKKVWGPCADWGSSYEDVDGYCITAVNPNNEEEEMQTTLLQLRKATAKAFNTLREAEQYRDSLWVDEWAIEHGVPPTSREDSTVTLVLSGCEES